MKTNVLKMGFPIAVVVFAIAGAFANNMSRANLTTTLDIKGRVPVSCALTNVTCTTIPNQNMCTFGGQQLYQLNIDGTDCPDALYKKN
jgi:hypothetical protein